MPKRSSKTQKQEDDADDPNVTAFRVVQQATEGEDGGRGLESDGNERPELPEKNPAAVALGRLGGLKGGKARAAKLSPERKSEIARKAAQARWSKDPGT